MQINPVARATFAAAATAAVLLWIWEDALQAVNPTAATSNVDGERTVVQWDFSRPPTRADDRSARRLKNNTADGNEKKGGGAVHTAKPPTRHGPGNRDRGWGSTPYTEGRVSQRPTSADTALLNNGCRHIHREKMHPGGFGASLMRVLWKFHKVGLNESRDLFLDASTWSYRCNDKTSAMECFFQKRLPCPDPELHLKEYSKKKINVLLADWNMTDQAPGTLALPETRTPELWAELSPLNVPEKKVALLRRLAQHLLRLQPATEQRIRDRVKAAGVDLSEPFVSIHFRRGDKFREAYSTAPSSAAIVSRIKRVHPNFKWIFALTDDARAVEDLRAAAPSGWRVVSFADPKSVGFNECMLPSVRKIRKGACGNMCQNLTQAAFGKIRQRSYCFMNPAEPDNSKLIPVPMDTDESIQAEAGFGMLVDAWLATKSEVHMSVGCGSNVDKLIHVLRTDPENTTVCYDSAKHACKGGTCFLKRCNLNVESGVLGLGCVDEVFQEK